MKTDLSIADLNATYLFATKEKKIWEEKYFHASEDNDEEVKSANEKCKYWTNVLEQVEAALSDRILSVFQP